MSLLNRLLAHTLPANTARRGRYGGQYANIDARIVRVGHVRVHTAAPIPAWAGARTCAARARWVHGDCLRLHFKAQVHHV